MQLSPILSGYIARNFIISFFCVFAVLLCVVFLFDVIELLRRAASSDNITVGMILKMGLLKLPFMGQELFPFAVLFGAMVAFWRLTRSRELMVTRAAGVSAWQFLLPVLVLAFLLGVVKISAFNPLASALLTKYDRMDATLLKGQSSFLSLSKTGLWLRQANEKNQSVVHAYHVTLAGQNISLRDVTIFIYASGDRFAGRLTAKSGRLEDGFWHLSDVWIYKPDQPLRHEAESWFATDLTLGNIQDSFAPPETMSFWDLPKFIENLDRSGFSALRHRLYWHTLLAAPLLLCAMILIAATFTLRQSRTGSTALIVLGGVFTAFVLFFFSDIVFALGLRDSIPIALAAWTPSGVCTLLGLAMVFHLEDG